MIPARIPDNVVFDLDQRWIGVDERTDAGAMPGSSEVRDGSRVREARNVRFTGAVESRDGYVFSARYNPPGPHHLNDSNWNAGKMTGSGTYVDPNTGVQYLMMQRDYSAINPLRRVWFCNDRSGPFYVPCGDYGGANYTANFREADLVRFSQLGGDVVLWRRAGEAPWLWDGDRSGEFLRIADVEPNDPTPAYYIPLPAAEFGCVAADRLVFPYEGGIAWTDILEARRWADADEEGNPNYLTVGDDGGAVTGLHWWRSNTLLVFKERSVWAVENFSGDLSTIALRLLTRQAGCMAPDSVVEVAGDVLWLGNGAVWSLSKVLDTDTVMNDRPVSWLIPQTMARVNWSKAHLSRAVLAREHVFWALPVDGETSPKTLLVLSAVTREWQGKDVPGGNYSDSDTYREVHGLLRCTLWGRETLAIVRQRNVLTLGWSWKDTGSSADPGDFETYVKFRGYHAQEHSLTRWVRMEAETEEVGTEGVTLSACGDGHGTEIPLQGATTRDRTAWLAWGRVPRDMSNNDDDFDEPGREDYACVLEDGGVELHSGVQTARLQAHRLAGNVTGKARALSPVVRTTAGRLRINLLRAAGVR